MTLSSDISTTSTALSDIKQAIIDKGVTPSGNITTYAAAISNISTVNNTTLTVTPTTSSQSLTPPSPYTGYSSVSVNAVTSSIDANITAGNIKKDVQILGVTGTYEGTTPTLTTKNITQNGTYNASSDNADGYSSVTVNVSGGGGNDNLSNLYCWKTTSAAPSYFRNKLVFTASESPQIGDYVLFIQNTTTFYPSYVTGITSSTLIEVELGPCQRESQYDVIFN